MKIHALTLKILILCFSVTNVNAVTAQDSTIQLESLGLVSAGEKLIGESYQLCAQAKEKLQEGENLIQTAPKLDNIAKAFGKAVELNGILARNVQQLIQMGEPSGYDLRFRSNAIRERMTQIRDVQHRSLCANLGAPAEQVRRSNAGKMGKSRQKIVNLTRKGKFEDAEEEYLRLVDFTSGFAFFLQPKSRVSFGQELSVGNQAAVFMNQQRGIQFRILLQNSFSESIPKYENKLKAFDAAIKELSESGVAKIARTEKTGPELLEFCFREFQTIHRELIQSQVISAALKDEVAVKKTEREKEQVLLLLKKYTKKIIDANARRVDQDEAQTLYHDYLKKFALLSKTRESKEILLTCRTDLERIAEKSPSFVRQVDAYKLATEELMYWRAKYAKSRASVARRTFNNTKQLLFQSLSPLDKPERRILDDVPVKADDPVSSRLIFSLDVTTAKCRDRLVDKRVALTDAAKIGTDYISGIQDRYWAKAPIEFSLENEIEALKADLMVTADLPPLTFEAAFSISTAVLQSFLEVGGTIKDVEVESFLIRMNKLGKQSEILTPIGRIHALPAVNHMLISLDVKPLWISHKHFFVFKSPDASADQQASAQKQRKTELNEKRVGT